MDRQNYLGDGIHPSPTRALVTGGAGFLGSHLCDRLIEVGCETLCLDNLLTGRLDNVSHLLKHPLFKFVENDLTQPIEIEGPLDCILHFASPASPKDYRKHPIQTLEVGSLGTSNMLNLARQTGASFILASSSEVYGDPQVNPQAEDYWGHVNPVGPRSVYDEAKRFAEALSIAYQREYGLDVRIARFFNCFGPRMKLDDGRAVPTFMAQSLRGEPLTVYGDGSQTRSFCYVDDIVEAVFVLLNFKPQEYAQRSNLIFNFGNPEELTILQLAHKVIDLTGSRSKVVFTALPEDDPRVRRPDITKAWEMLRWTPQISYEDGLQRIIPYFKAQLGQIDV